MFFSVALLFYNGISERKTSIFIHSYVIETSIFDIMPSYVKKLLENRISTHISDRKKILNKILLYSINRAFIANLYVKNEHDPFLHMPISTLLHFTVNRTRSFFFE